MTREENGWGSTVDEALGKAIARAQEIIPKDHTLRWKMTELSGFQDPNGSRRISVTIQFDNGWL